MEIIDWFILVSGNSHNSHLFPLAKLSRLAKSNIISNFFKIIIVIAGTRTRRTEFTLYYALAPIKILFVLVVVVAIVVVLFVVDIHIFNRDLNRGCLVYMFSLRFSGSKFLIYLRRQFRVRKIFRTQGLRDLQSFHFVFKITISKMRNLSCRLLFV